MSTLKVFGPIVNEHNFSRYKTLCAFWEALAEKRFWELLGHFLGTSGQIPGYFKAVLQTGHCALRVANYVLRVTSWYSRYHEAFFLKQTKRVVSVCTFFFKSIVEHTFHSHFWRFYLNENSMLKVFRVQIRIIIALKLTFWAKMSFLNKMQFSVLGQVTLGVSWWHHKQKQRSLRDHSPNVIT